LTSNPCTNQNMRQNSVMNNETRLIENVTSSQLKTRTCRPSREPSALTDSVLPVPAGPYGLPPSPIRKAFGYLERQSSIGLNNI
jgi:hypothetical protein